MTPMDFREGVLPGLINRWESRCFCDNPSFRKLISFNFKDFDIGPVGLADSEILISDIVRNRFVRTAGKDSHDLWFRCPQCESECEEVYEDFSISMSRSYITYKDRIQLPDNVLYLVGFYGFKSTDFEKVIGFERTKSIDAFVHQFDEK